MATNMTPAGTILNGLLVKTGWNDDTQLELALRFISEDGDKQLVKWHEFLQERVTEESDRTKCFGVEYDTDYTGGDYSGVGQHAYIPFFELDKSPKGLPEEQAVQETFHRVTGIAPIHIIFYNIDEPVDENGEFWEK